MRTDAELLRKFAGRRDENAFAELVNRHINMVYSAACRENKDDLSVAQDVTQLVFIELARKATALQKHPTLAGWLYTSVRYISTNLRRTNRRRKNREEEVCAMNEWICFAANDSVWQDAQPALHAAMHDLDESDRNAVRLRFFEGMTLREIGDALCLTENAARRRVERALDKLRTLMVKRGVCTLNWG